jgi:shikimate dehydrogenase
MVTASDQPDRYCVVGHPVAHSRSPMIHQFFAKQTGQALTYELMDASPDELEVAIRGFQAAGGKGMNVTVPHKEGAFAIAQECSADAKRAGSVNTLTFRPDGRIQGDNTDGIGMMRDITVNLGEPVQGRRVLVLGAGGAALGIVGPLLDAAPDELVIANRNVARADALAERFAGDGPVRACGFDALAESPPFDLLINATSVGLKGEPPPFPTVIIGERSMCYDLVYSLGDTPFVTWAREAGARRAEQGWGMLVEQAAESFHIWRGIRPDTTQLLHRQDG